MRRRPSASRSAGRPEDGGPPSGASADPGGRPAVCPASDGSPPREDPCSRQTGLATAVPAEHRPDPAGYQAVLLGSAVYQGRWQDAARDVAHAHLTTLRARPVWLFSSGPIGEPPFPPDEPHDVATIGPMLGARGHRVFPGRLDPRRLTFGERAVVTAMRAPLGDFRDWSAVRSWAGAITAELLPLDGAGTPTEDTGSATPA
ncbi:flavodoxin domain-containing protein [Geodermatophilus sp. TF02-6]|uniref:flavodoxin domain-containing protein n=1 Tax=Geodermatophilus sp. TF02-6 TaxID=2250575 RepID=UPI00131488A7|nr:flavodoxin domain-containing protein [Geodermatophilus sp. TF02-6]